ncbi:MAG: hypothetical protein M1814_004765 [Vezdaea aestivalis]|nr:MAG: hypothetical protein M1814_004765 [Vezdaea aestivalis]
MRPFVICTLLLGGLSTFASAWGKDDHEIFRLNDEIAANEGPGITFYEFLGLTPSASQDDITKALKKKAKTLHPDKVKQRFVASHSTGKPKPKGQSKSNKKPGVHVSKGPTTSEVDAAYEAANKRWARLGVVAAILRGPGRARYDHFLKNGFPRWKGTGYYYARFRPGLGSVLVGLFVIGGGAAHYGALYLGWKRQREFVGRYIKHARRAAWGDELGIKGIDGVGTSAAAAGSATKGNIGLDAGKEDSGMVGLNRRQRRQQEKEGRRKGPAKENGNGTTTPDIAPVAVPSSGPQGERKKIVAENGKVLIVDSTGSVYLEEENDDGETEVFLLDVNEIPPPTIRQTALVRLPLWAWQKTIGAVFRRKADNAEVDVGGDEASGDEIETEDTPSKSKARRRGKRNGKAR